MMATTTIRLKNFFGDELSESDSVALRLRNLRLAVDALNGQLASGVEASVVYRQLLEAIELAR